jgi:hypothetical protein
MRPIRTATFALLAINAGIFVAYLITRVILWSGTPLPATVQSLLQEFDVDAEGTVPTWYSVVLLAAAGGLALLTGVLRRREGQSRWGWWIAAGIVLMLLSLDESASIHEQAFVPMQRLFGVMSGPFAFAWVIAGLAAVAVVIIVFARFYLSLPNDTKLGLGIGAVVYLGGSLGMEMLAGALVPYLVPIGSGTSFAMNVLSGIEELLEMTGVVLVIRAILVHLARHVTPAGKLELSLV